jgi:hypothetical protein
VALRPYHKYYSRVDITDSDKTLTCHTKEIITNLTILLIQYPAQSLS